ncbi:MAG: hypothetical protein OXR66_07105 [Candidatus Woesearchaeota archaeon]|nr:hypothetical protein [Candidatus Woesearchaeota archaeon]
MYTFDGGYMFSRKLFCGEFELKGAQDSTLVLGEFFDGREIYPLEGTLRDLDLVTEMVLRVSGMPLTLLGHSLHGMNPYVFSGFSYRGDLPKNTREFDDLFRLEFHQNGVREERPQQPVRQTLAAAAPLEAVRVRR